MKEPIITSTPTDHMPAAAGRDDGPTGKTLHQAGFFRTVIVCMLANNLTLGLMYGTFGALLASNEQAFAVARDTISFGMSALTTTMGLSALVMGNLVRRLTPRISIAIGSFTAACAFAGLGMATSLAVAMAMWSILGFSIAMAALLGPVALAAELFPEKSGKFLAMVNLPVVLFVSPWLFTAILPTVDRDGAYFIMAAILFPVALLVLLYLPKRAPRTPAERRAAPDTPAGVILRRTDFWLVSLGIAVIASTGTAYTVHAIPYAQSEGLSVSASALMFSAYMGAGLIGVPLFGWLADRFGAPRTLALSGVIQCLCWAGLALMPAIAFVPISVALGAATTPLTTLHGAAMAQIFKADGVGKAMGYSFAVKLPFLFVAPPAVGYAYVHLADYRPALLAVAVSLVFAVALLIAASTLIRRVAPRTGTKSKLGVEQ